MQKKPVRAKRAAKKPASSKTAAKPQDSTDETPVDYMLRVMRDPDAEPQRRDTMAKSATPYIHRKPAPKKKKAGGSDTSLKRRLETARETLAGKIAGLRSEGD